MWVANWPWPARKVTDSGRIQKQEIDLNCDPGRHLQECPGARHWKVPHGVLFECFWAPGSECSKECFLSVFCHFWGRSLGQSEPGAQKHSKSTPWGTFQPGTLGMAGGIAILEFFRNG